MATYNLNEKLKERAAAKVNTQKTDDGVKKLDDVTRVKVLSPGRQVFKRFIRNRLAVFGTTILIIMFLFSFVGPLFYPYGQTQIFYKYEPMNLEYAIAKENTAYNGYDIADVELPHKVVNAMNSNIKDMISKGETSRIVFDKENNPYIIKALGNEVYTLGTAEITEAAIVGEYQKVVGTFKAGKSLTFNEEEIPGLEDAVKKVISPKGSTADSVEVDGITYTFNKLNKMEYEVCLEADGINPVGDLLDEGGIAAVEAAAEAGESTFEYNGQNFVIVANKKNSTVYAANELETGKVYTRFILMTYVTGEKVSDEFKAQALYNAYTTGAFTVDGKNYTIAPNADADELVITCDGQEYAEFTFYSVKRKSGADSMEYDLKKAVAEHIQEMEATGAKVSDFNFAIPDQDPETGVQRVDENGNIMYADSEMEVTRSATGEYIIKADIVTYLINIHEAPSSVHLLGTDGDGFDVLSRIMYGGRISLMVGFVVVILELILGIIMGGLAGYFGGWVDTLIMRLVDIFYCLPSMPIMIILGALMDALRMDTYIRLMVMMAMLGIMGWAGVARLVRGQILSLREQEFMIAAEATGIRVKHRIFRHLIPNVMPQLIVTATMGLGGVIITESTLSFLGLGVKHPLATWGTIINSVSSASDMAHFAFIWIPVGLLICLTVVAFNFVGDGLRDAYDPKSKR